MDSNTQQGDREMKTETATFYDHATNQANAAAGWAIAKVRREVIAEGKAYKVLAKWAHQDTPFYWDGGMYDALRLAKQLLFNRCEVQLIAPDGHTVDIAAARY